MHYLMKFYIPSSKKSTFPWPKDNKTNTSPTQRSCSLTLLFQFPHPQPPSLSWITSPLALHIFPAPTTSNASHCFCCQDPDHKEENCPMYYCPTCQNQPTGHLQHLCPQAQCDFCKRWGQSKECCSLHNCGTCDACRHVTAYCPFNNYTPQKAYTIYGGYDNEDQVLWTSYLNGLLQR